MYDISVDNIRTKVANKLSAEGFERIQYSVFSGHRNPKEIKPLWSQLTEWLLIDHIGIIFIIRVSKESFKSMKVLGNHELEMDYLTGDLTSIFF